MSRIYEVEKICNYKPDKMKAFDGATSTSSTLRPSRHTSTTSTKNDRNRKHTYTQRANSPSEQLQKERREKKPFFYCRWVAHYPKRTFFICLSLHLSVVVVSGALLGSGYDLVPTNFESMPMELYDVPHRLRDLAFRSKNNYPQRFSRFITNDAVHTWERGLLSTDGSVDVYFDTKGGNIFTKLNLLKMKEIEIDLMLTDQYQEHWCMTYNVSLACNKPISVMRYFDGSLAHLSPVFDDPNFDNISGVLYEAYNNPKTKSEFEFFLPKSFLLTLTKAEADLTRMVFPMGCSYYGEKRCSNIRWYEPAKEFSVGPLVTKLDMWMKKSSHFDVYYYSFVIWRKQVIQQAMKDILYAVGSMLFIFCFMAFHTRSLWVTFFAVLSILTSFLGANLIYRCVIGFQYFGFFHILAIFIILGIGADDLFVFYDSWRLTAFHSYPSLAHRLSDAYSKSTLSMLMTSLTTMVAFLCSAISPLLATRSFGVFAGVLVIYNYISVIIFFPTVVVMYHKKFEECLWPCCRCCKRDNDSNNTDDQNNSEEISPPPKGQVNPMFTMHPEHGPSEYANKHTELVDRKVVNGKASMNGNHFLQHENRGVEKVVTFSVKKNKHIQRHAPTSKKDGKHQSKLVVFFRDYYFRFVTNLVTQRLLLPVFVGIVVFFAYEASSLEPDNENLQIYKENHHFTKASDAEMYKFLYSPSENLVKINIVWGLKENDRSDCHFSSIQCNGVNVYDDKFDPNPVANQKALMDFCATFEKLSSAEVSQLRIKRNPKTQELEVACFTEHLNQFLESKSTAIGMNMSLPWNHTHVKALMESEPGHFDAAKFNSSFPNILEIPVQYWLYNGYSMNYSQDYGLYNHLFGEQMDSWSQSLKKYPAIKYGNKLKYLVVEVNTTVNRYVTGFSKGIPIAEKWESFINSKVSEMPDGLKGGFQLTRTTWHWLYVQKVMVDNALLGIAVGISLAFVILSLSTMNIIIGFFATLSIACTTVCVVGVIPLVGWKLGILVSLNMCMLVGLAVDYVVHLAEGYHLSLHTDRVNRTRDMLEEMGTSVFSGACTTLGSSLFMFFTDIQFFMQFGAFLFCTIGFSLLFSLGLFTVLMGLIGPENDFGSLNVLFMKCFSCCKRKQEVEK